MLGVLKHERVFVFIRQFKVGLRFASRLSNIKQAILSLLDAQEFEKFYFSAAQFPSHANHGAVLWRHPVFFKGRVLIFRSPPSGQPGKFVDTFVRIWRMQFHLSKRG